MMIVAKNAEPALLQMLKVYWEKFPLHRCLYLKFSQLGLARDEWISELSAALETIGEAQNAQVYICKDYDVFVVTRSLTHRRLNQFLAHLAPKLEPVPLRGLAFLFEISVDWAQLKTLCEKKLEIFLAEEKLQNQNSRKHSDSEQDSDFEPILAELDRDLLSSLSMRRDMRVRAEILVVEDDPFTRRLVENILKDRYGLSMAEDGTGAVCSYVNKAPDIVFLDIGLPDVEGHKVLENIFKLDPHAFVVMFSGNGDRENILRSIELGAKGFIGKPFTQEKLMQYITKSPFVQAKLSKENHHGHSIH